MGIKARVMTRIWSMDAVKLYNMDRTWVRQSLYKFALKYFGFAVYNQPAILTPTQKLFWWF